MTSSLQEHLELPIVSVDTVVMSLKEQDASRPDDKTLHVLLVRRAPIPGEPFPERWSLPGAMIQPSLDPDVDACARRVLSEKTGLAKAAKWLEQLSSFGSATRDPRGWSISMAYYALIPFDAPHPSSNRVMDCRWFPVDEALSMNLPFDHSDILALAVERLRSKVGYSMLATRLLPDEFTLFELQRVHEQILGIPLDKSSFRKRLASVDCLETVEGRMRKGSNRPAALWRVKKDSPLHLFRRSI